MATLDELIEQEQQQSSQGMSLDELVQQEQVQQPAQQTQAQQFSLDELVQQEVKLEKSAPAPTPSREGLAPRMGRDRRGDSIGGPTAGEQFSAMGTMAQSSLTGLLEDLGRGIRGARNPAATPITREEFENSVLADQGYSEERIQEILQQNRERSEPNMTEQVARSLAPSPEEYQEARSKLNPMVATGVEMGASILPFMASGPMGAVLLGTGTGQGELIRDAEEQGVTDPEVLNRQELYGGALGVGQALPVFSAFGRLGNKVGMDALARATERLPAGEALKFLGRAAKTGAAEAGQETLLYELPKNLIARDLEGFDPDRNIWQGMPEIAAGGFTTGALVQGIMEGALGRRMARYRKNEAEAAAQPMGELDTPYFVDQTTQATESLEGGFNFRRLLKESNSPDRVAGEQQVLAEISSLAPADTQSAETIRTAMQNRMFPLRDQTTTTAELVEDSPLRDGLTTEQLIRARQLHGQIKEARARNDTKTVADLKKELLSFLPESVAPRQGPFYSEFTRKWSGPIARPGNGSAENRKYFGHTEGFVDSDGITNVDRLESELLGEGVGQGKFVDGTDQATLQQEQEKLTELIRAQEEWLRRERRRTNADADELAARRPAVETLVRLNPRLQADRLLSLDDMNFSRFLDSRIKGAEDRVARMSSIQQSRNRNADGWRKMLVRREITRAAEGNRDKIRFATGEGSNLTPKVERWLRKEYDTKKTRVGGKEYLEVDVPEDYGSTLVTGGPMNAEVQATWEQTRELYEKLRVPNAKVVSQAMGSFGKGKQLWTNLLQLSRRFDNVEGLQNYTQRVRDWWVEQMYWTERADTRIRDWRGLGREQRDKLSEYQLSVGEESFKKERRLTDEELRVLRNKIGLSEEAFAVWQNIDQDYQDVITELENTMRENINRNIDPAVNPQQNQQEKEKITEELEPLRNMNYTPFSRFGEYIILVKDGADNVLYRQHFTSKIQRNIVASRIRKKGIDGRGLEQGQFVVKDTESIESQANTLVPDFLKAKLEEDLNLSQEQRQVFSEILVALAPARTFARNLLRRKGTAGYTRDAMRGYADYFQRFGKHMARLKHAGYMQDAIQQIRKEGEAEGNRSGNAETHTQIANWSQEHFDYLMDPGVEWAAVRSITFIGYLGWNIKSATVNLTQLAMTTYPYLAARFGKGPGLGDVGAVAELGKAMGTTAGNRAMKSVQKIVSKAMRDGSESYVKPGLIETELDEAIQRGIRESFLDESLATELASAATQSGAEAFVPSTGVGRTARGVARSGAFMFQAVEKLNRRVTFIAAFRLARRQLAKGRPWHLIEENVKEQIYIEARDAVDRTQYEYARWNRPKFMRGRKSVIFMFFQYLQNTLHFMSKEPGRMRSWMVLMAMGGAMGLPFAENILDLLDALFTEYPELRKKLGLGEKPITDLRLEGRELLNTYTDDEELTDMIMHGAARKYGLGPLHALTAAGAPIPNIDISGSISMGAPIPGITEALRGAAYGQEFEQIAFRGAENMLGASAGLVGGVLRAAGTDDPNTLKRIERAMPTAAKNLSESIRWLTDEGVTDYSGAKIIDFDPNDPMDQASLLFNAMSFPLTEVNREKEIRWSQYVHSQYFTARRSQLLKQYFYALSKGSEELKNIYWKEIRKYNATVPSGQLKIGPSQIVDSMVTRFKNVAKSEQGLPRDKRFIQMYNNIRSRYPQIDEKMQEEGLELPPRIEDIK